MRFFRRASENVHVLRGHGGPSVQHSPAADPEIFYWVDHTVSFITNTGMQRVTRLLARSLHEQGKRLVFVCWDVDRQGLRRATRTELRALASHGGPHVDPGSENFTQAGELVPTDELAGRWLLIPEVTHITYHRHAPTVDIFAYAKWHSLRTAWIFYDAVPLKMPGYEKVRSAHANYMRGLINADLVLPISFSSSEDLLSFWGPGATSHFPKVKTHVLPGEFVGTKRVTEYRETGSGSVRILCVGSIEPRKNHLWLINAFNRLARERPDIDFQLHLIGNVSGELHSVIKKATRKNPKIHSLGFVGDDKLEEYYRQAHFTVLPSVSEGFGLPILESVWYGKPCVCANFGAMSEVAKDGGCLMVDCHFASEIYGAIKKLSLDAGLRRRLAEQAIRRPIKTWKEYASEVAVTLERTHAHISVG